MHRSREIAAKRFCLRYCATGWVGNNDYLLPYAKYGVFQNDSGESINGKTTWLPDSIFHASTKDRDMMSTIKKTPEEYQDRLPPIPVSSCSTSQLEIKITKTTTCSQIFNAYSSML